MINRVEINNCTDFISILWNKQQRKICKGRQFRNSALTKPSKWLFSFQNELKS